MLTIEETKKALDAGEIVYLEHNVRGKALNELYFSELEKLEVGYVNINENGLRDGVYIKDGSGHVRNSSYFIPKEELKYFCIKPPAPCFIELIKLVEDAKNKKLIGSFCAINSDYQQEIMVIIKETTYKWDFNNQGVKGAYDLIDSLYTETFVIESNYFPELKVGGKFTQNGIEWELDEERIESIVNTPLFILKGATVTQKRGAQC